MSLEQIAFPQGGSAVPAAANHKPDRCDLFAQQIAVISAVLMAVIALVFFITAFSHPFWQVYALAAATSTSLLFCLFAIAVTGENQTYRRLLVLLPVINLTIILFSALVANTALIFAILNFLFGAIAVTGSLQGGQRDNGISLAFAAAIITLLAGVYSPLDQIRLPQVEIYLPVFLSVVLMAYIVLLVLEVVVANLRIKLLTGSLAIAILPLLVVSLVNTRFIRDALREQTHQAVLLAAEQSAARIDQFFESTLSLVESQAKLPVYAAFFEEKAGSHAGSDPADAVSLTINAFPSREQRFFRSFALLDSNGIILFDSNQQKIGSSEQDQPYFLRPLSTGQAYASEVIFDPETNNPYIYFAAPVRDLHQRVLGVIRAQFDAYVLQDILTYQSGVLGHRSYPILLDENWLRLADTLEPCNLFLLVKPLSSDHLSQLIREHRVPNRPVHEMSTNGHNLALIARNNQSERFFSLNPYADDPEVYAIGTVVSLKMKPWSLVFAQQDVELAGLFQSQDRVSTLISTLIAALVGLFSTIIAGSFSKPIVRLQETALKISSGHLQASALVETNDEIGSLAQAFNHMTDQLRSSINELEGRVAERTSALSQQNETLRFRSRQLQTVSEVARQIVGAQGLEALLSQLTTLISERFGFYHVGVFLIDSQGEYAVLQAANSPGGKRMLARQHRLKVGQVGIVGFVTSSGQARIATDVGKDAVYFDNPDLPHTRSEMALPLQARGQIIGALDVQSTEPDAFTNEDIELFSILADQIAIAILNNRLYEETLQALQESERVHRQYLRQEWGKDIQERPVTGYHFSNHGLTPLHNPGKPELDEVFKSGKPIAKRPGSPGDPAALTVPIRLRGATIGAVYLEDDAISDRIWTQEEVDSITTVADQIGVALENARLLEKTIRRAERERRVLEITGKIRSSNDPQAMIEIALQELKRTLNASRAQLILENPQDTGAQVDHRLQDPQPFAQDRKKGGAG